MELEMAKTRRGEPAARLIVTMLGQFSIRYGETVLKLERNNSTRAMQALQMLLYSGGQGLPRAVLMDRLYGRDERVTDPANNLKVTISNLRKRLAQAGLPGTTIQFSGGNYRWQSTLPTEVDVDCFYRQANAALAETGPGREEALQRACALYTGDFLPHLQGEEWAVAVAVHCRELYGRCVRALTDLLRARGADTEVLTVATRASALCPQEEWDALRIESLLALERYQEAKAVYEETATRLEETFGVKPSGQLIDALRKLEQVAPERAVSMEQLQTVLAEDTVLHGAYYCPFPSFIDTYRAVGRMLERSGQSAYLMLCWLTDRQGQPLGDRERLVKATPQVSAAIQTALRRGDAYTQPCAGRFLILLMGLTRENCTLVSDRIDDRFRATPDRARGVVLHYKSTPVGSPGCTQMMGADPGWK